MLFDRKDLTVFENDYERDAFQEVVQTYYSKNYRASVVSLYALVMLDLYNKLQYMAEEGEEKAVKELERVNGLIEDDEKYSKVEKEITDFFANNYSLHFNKFENDLVYLKNTRNDCAHLKVNASSLSTPKDYQVKMLICSMFENLFSVKAPFMDDLFSFVEEDAENYSKKAHTINWEETGDSIYQKYKRKYFSRMTQTSLLNSVRTIIKLLFVSTEDGAVKNSYGLYIILRCLLQFIDENGLGAISMQDEKMQALIMKIEEETLKISDTREKALFIFLCTTRWFCDEFRKNNLFKQVIEKYIFKQTFFEKYYMDVLSESEESRWQYYIKNSARFPCDYYESRYRFLKEDAAFSDIQFIESEANNIPHFNGFNHADKMMSFFFNHIDEFSNEAVVKMVCMFNSNTQFFNRNGGNGDIKALIQIAQERDMNIDWEDYYAFARYIQNDEYQETVEEFLE